MTEARKEDSFYTCEVIAKCFADEEVRKGFMSAYQDGPGPAKAYMEKLGMPSDLADAVSKKQGNDLNLFIGQNVCDYLW